MGIKKMRRMYLLQIWFSLSDPATEDAIYRKLQPPFPLYLCSVWISSAFRKSCKARWTVDLESLRLLEMAGMGGRQTPSLLVQADRYR